jgi:RNA polymerase sigma-70 factor (ECF subfamily)
MLSPMPSVPFEEEQELVARARAGDERAFETLVRHHADRLYAVVVRFLGSAQEAEDVTQEAFLRAWRGIARFDGDSRFFTWLYRIGINEAKRRGARGAGAAPTTSLDRHPEVETPDSSLAPETSAREAELQAVLEEAIRELKADHRAALILRDVEGLSTAEAAAAMGLGEAAFKSRLHRARRAVRSAVADYLGEDR